MVLISEQNKMTPPCKGVFFAITLVIIIAGTGLIGGCNNNSVPSQPEEKKKTEKQDKFVYLRNRPTILEKSYTIMSGSNIFKSSEAEVFNEFIIENKPTPVDLDIEYAYGSSYPDNRKVVFYPIKNLRIPQGDEILPLGVLHYFDDKNLNIFFQVTVQYSEEILQEPSSSDAPPPSNYKIVFTSHEKKTYGLVRSRILQKEDLVKEEAFRSFETSDRKVQMGTNSMDENKFLFIFLKIPDWKNELFQIYFRWY